MTKVHLTDNTIESAIQLQSFRTIAMDIETYMEFTDLADMVMLHYTWDDALNATVAGILITGLASAMKATPSGVISSIMSETTDTYPPYWIHSGWDLFDPVKIQDIGRVPLDILQTMQLHAGEVLQARSQASFDTVTWDLISRGAQGFFDRPASKRPASDPQPPLSDPLILLS